MGQGFLVMSAIDAGARFIGEFQKFAPIASAAWLKEDEEGLWYLYLLSDQIDSTNRDIAYGEIFRITQEMAPPRLDPFRVRIVAADDPSAADLRKIQLAVPQTTPPPISLLHVGPMPVDDLYVYDPLPAPATAP